MAAIVVVQKVAAQVARRGAQLAVTKADKMELLWECFLDDPSVALMEFLMGNW